MSIMLSFNSSNPKLYALKRGEQVVEDDLDEEDEDKEKVVEEVEEGVVSDEE